MNEVYIITASWWQVALYSMIMVFYGVGLMKLAPLIEKKLDRFIKDLKKQQKADVIIKITKEGIFKKEGYLLPPETADKLFKYVMECEPFKEKEGG